MNNTSKIDQSTEEDLVTQSSKQADDKKINSDRSTKVIATLTVAMISTIITLICLIPFGFIFNKKIPNPIGVVDLQKLVDENQNTILGAIINSPDISEQQRMLAHQQAQEFASKLTKAVEETAAECQCVLINKAAVLTENQKGVLVDYTDKIRKKVKN